MSAFVFFQAEDGIRDIGVTGVQTCALPIYCDIAKAFQELGTRAPGVRRSRGYVAHKEDVAMMNLKNRSELTAINVVNAVLARSEERRVGKECRSRWSPYH